MRWLTSSAAIVLLTLCSTAQASGRETINASSNLDPVRVEKARVIVELIVPADQREAMFSKIIDAFMTNSIAGVMQANPEINQLLSEEPELRQIFATFVERQRNLVLQDLEETSPELMFAYTNAYARAFTAKELDGLNAFFVTPVGRKYVSMAPGLMADPDFAAWQKGVAARAEARKDEELKKLMDQVMPVIRAKGAKNHGS